MHRVRLHDDGTVEGDWSVPAGALGRARHVLALTGAGISVDSGIPDFRSPGGLWSEFDPMEYATLTCFLRTPEKAWALFRALGKLLVGRRPNPAHHALAALERAGRLAAVVTQNIDGLHQAAGSRRVLEIHGDARNLHCLQCAWQAPLEARHLDPGPIPRCPRCSFPLKPTVVLFEEPVRQMQAIRRELVRTDLLLVIGTSAEVAPASLFPDEVRARGGRVLECNVHGTLLTPTLEEEDIFLQGRASATLPRLLRAVGIEVGERS